MDEWVVDFVQVNKEVEEKRRETEGRKGVEEEEPESEKRQDETKPTDESDEEIEKIN